MANALRAERESPSLSSAPGPPPEIFREIWEASPDGLFSMRVDGPEEFVVEACNPALERLLGQPASVGQTLWDILDPVSAQKAHAHFCRCVAEGVEVTYRETFEFPSGIALWETRLTPIRDGSGRIARLFGVSSIVRPPEHPRAVIASRFELDKILDSFPHHIALLNDTGEIYFVNRAWREFAAANGGDGEDTKRNYLDVCAASEAAGDADAGVVRNKLLQLMAGTVKAITHTYACGDRFFLLRGMRFKVGGVRRYALNHQDVTDLVLAERALATTSEMLLAVQEEERARIAVELHDSTSQHLVAIGLGLAALKRARDPESVLEDMRRSLAEAQREIRTLAYLLYPPKLSRQGLEVTLRGFLEGFRRRTGLLIANTTFGPLDELPFELQRAVFRIVQESLANVHRHSNARRVAVEILLKKKGLRILIVDDGHVADAAAPPPTPGVGIRGMRTRVQLFDGQLTVRHEPFGTVVDAFIPRAGFGKRAQAPASQPPIAERVG